MVSLLFNPELSTTVNHHRDPSIPLFTLILSPSSPPSSLPFSFYEVEDVEGEDLSGSFFRKGHAGVKGTIISREDLRGFINPR